MTSARTGAAVLAAVALLTMAGCSSGKKASTATTTSTTAATATTTTAAPSSTTATTAAPSTSATSATTAGTTAGPATTVPGAVHPTLTDAIRGQLVSAAAAANGLTASDYIGLEPGHSYYALDNATGTYWAAGSLVPSPSSEQAQVSTQDDGSYLVFSKQGSGPWTVHDVGMAGIGGSSCGVTIPADVLALWAWAPGTCYPPR